MRETVILLQTSHCFYDEAKINNGPPGENLANHIMKEMSHHDVLIEQPYPYIDESAWVWYVKIKGIEYYVHLQWAPLGSPYKDYWVIQCSRRQGFVKSVLGIKPQVSDISLLLDTLHLAIDKDPIFTSVEWVTEDKFDELY